MAMYRMKNSIEFSDIKKTMERGQLIEHKGNEIIVNGETFGDTSFLKMVEAGYIVRSNEKQIRPKVQFNEMINVKPVPKKERKTFEVIRENPAEERVIPIIDNTKKVAKPEVVLNTKDDNLKVIRSTDSGEDVRGLSVMRADKTVAAPVVEATAKKVTATKTTAKKKVVKKAAKKRKNVKKK